jgi:hypothetical protein
MCWGIALPSDEVLLFVPIMLISEDLFYFPFFLTINKIR